MEQAFQRARGRGIDVRQQTDGGVHGLGAPQRLPIRQRARPSLCEESLRGTSERNLLRREGERPRAPAPPPGYGLSGRPGQARRRGSGRRMIRCTAKLTSAIRLYDPTLWTVAGQVWVDGGHAASVPGGGRAPLAARTARLHQLLRLLRGAGNPSPWGNGEIFPHAHRSASPCPSGKNLKCYCRMWGSNPRPFD